MSAIRIIARHILMTLPMLGIVLAAHAETYPSGVIRIVVPTGPGTPPDVIGRVIATELAEAEGWRMVVENKPGALQTIGMSDVLKQPADGYTIYSMSVPTAAVPALMPNLGMRPDVDFTPDRQSLEILQCTRRTSLLSGEVHFRTGDRPQAEPRKIQFLVGRIWNSRTPHWRDVQVASRHPSYPRALSAVAAAHR